MTRLQLPLSAAIRRLEREQGENYTVKLAKRDGKCAVEIHVPNVGTATGISLRSMTRAFHNAEVQLGQIHNSASDAFDAALADADFDRAVESMEGDEDFHTPASVKPFTF